MENKVKDMQPPKQDGREHVPAESFEGSRGGWNADDVASQASQQNEDEIQRQIKRGDETKGDADERDNAGSADLSDTPQGREEAKNDVKGKANTNG